MIPKKIHYCWVGEKPLPKSAIRCIKSWKKYNSDYEIIEWNESNYDFMKNAYMKEAYEAKKWGFVPDFARLDIIYTYGGIYLDVDVEAIRCFDDLLNFSAFAGFEDDGQDAKNEDEIYNFNLGLGFGAEAGNSAIKILMDSYNDMHFRNEDGSLNLIASPLLNSDALVPYGLIKNGKRQNVLGMEILPKDYLSPKSLLDGVIRKTESTYAIHHFDASWLSDESRADMHARWKRKQKRIREKAVRGKIKSFGVAIFGEERYFKLRHRH